MSALSRFALRNPAVIVLLLLLIGGGGLYAAFSLHQEAFPDISLPLVTVTTTYPSASASVVVDSVTRPLEAAIDAVNGVQSLNSTSAAGISRIVAEFSVGSDTAVDTRAVQDAVNSVSLPSGTTRPTVVLNGPNSRPIVGYSLVGADVATLTSVAQNTVVPALQALGGVASVNIIGGATPNVLISADPAKLKQHGISITTLDNAVSTGIAAQPVGAVIVGGVTEPLRAGNTPASLAAIRALPVIPPSSSLSASLGVGRSGSGSSGSSATTQTAPYLLAAQAALKAYDGPSAQSGFDGLSTGPTAGAEADIADALSSLQTGSVATAASDTMLAEKSLVQKVARKNPSAYSNVNFANAVGWLQNANTAFALAGSNTAPLTVGDLATVSLATPGIGAIVRTNGQTSVRIQVLRTTTADTIQVSSEVRNTLNSMVLPRGLHFIKIGDSADAISNSVGGATREGLLGALLAVIIIGLFLRNWRATLIAVVTIPVAFLLTLICLNMLNLTLNVITLAGFAVATGRVVDDSIVVIENLYRRIAAGEPVTSTGILAGVVDVGAAITSSTATTICVFLPLAFAAGLVSTFFAPFAWTVTIALISSYLAAVTVVPLLAYALLRRGHVPAGHGEGAVARGYRRVLSWSLDHRLVVLGLAALSLLVAIGVLRRTPTNLIPDTGPASATVTITAPSGTSVQATGVAAAQLERVIGTDPDVDTYFTTIGDVNSSGLFGASSRIVQSNQGTISVNFKQGVDGTTATNHLRDLLQGVRSGAIVNVNRVGGTNSALEIDITGSNSAHIATLTRAAEAAVRAVGNVDQLSDTLTAATAELQAQVDPVRAARYGLTPAGVVTQLQAQLNGVTVAHLTLQGTSRAVMVAANTTSLTTPAALEGLPLSSGVSTLTLGQVAHVNRTNGTILISRHNQQLAAQVFGTITSNDVGGVSSSLARKLKNLAVPSDTSVVLSGVSQQQSTAFGEIFSAMAVAVALVFIVMVLAFGTLAAPVAILFALPVTLIGVALGLVLGRQPLGLPALIGMLMLIGIVVTNAIVLMTRVQQYRAAGKSLHEALLDAGANRLRPILMTAVATIGALFPLALGLAEGALISQSLADAVIGGLVSSTLLTLVVVPVVFSLLVPQRQPVGSRQ